MSIRVDIINGEEIWTDDKALLDLNSVDSILTWLKKDKTPDWRIHQRRPVMPIDWFAENIDPDAYSKMTYDILYFRRHVWRIVRDKVERYYWAACCDNPKIEIVGPEITLDGYNVIGPPPKTQEYVAKP